MKQFKDITTVRFFGGGGGNIIYIQLAVYLAIQVPSMILVYIIIGVL